MDKLGVFHANQNLSELKGLGLRRETGLSPPVK